MPVHFGHGFSCAVSKNVQGLCEVKLKMLFTCAALLTRPHLGASPAIFFPGEPEALHASLTSRDAYKDGSSFTAISLLNV